MNFHWGYFVLGLIAWQIIKMFALAINRAVIEHRQKKFLKLVNITFPDRKDVTFIAVDTSDKRAFKRVEQQLREQYAVQLDKSKHEVRHDRGGGFRN